ncbi:pyridoxal phosphate-dependent transferase [Dimargaris cristalligena]|uniref:serine C-palmitoyltransferase n=1 Tax=Dimargaris cristalligena TaxID=215637 RepID=A0A4V1J5J0_9FUNG|nr:pyridoxal phosphate-dependent transferase [Dimargaris cristalligena]|eukprot:RKP39229.1 pyridoxal phosphate-dependent transferase [Dimargaris cristalligena]
MEEPEVPLFILVSTYFSYLVLIIFAHVRDFLGKRFKSHEYTYLRHHDGFAPIFSDFESLWRRRLYQRIRDCFNRPITGVAGSYVTLIDRVTPDFCKTFELTGTHTRTLNLASYNYLGFAQSTGPCADSVEQAIERLGVGNASSVAEMGNSQLLRDTEAMVARFLGAEASLIVSMGFATNSTTIPALVSKGCLLISDELNHSSLVTGSRLSGATIRVFRHNSTTHLERVLREAISQGQPRTHRPWKKILVVVEGLYSMEGQFCDLPGIMALKDKYKFYLFVDEAHSIGAVGPRGRGVCDFYGIDPSKVDVLMGTFTKSFGAAGGYIAGRKSLINHLRLNNHASVYGESMSVPVLQQVASSIRIIMGEDGTHDGQRRLETLAFNGMYFAKRLRELGFLTLGSDGSPVVPMLLMNPAKIPAFSRECLKRGISVVVVSYPATPIITSRVRFCLSASHTKEDMDYALEQIEIIGRRLKLKLGTPEF